MFLSYGEMTSHLDDAHSDTWDKGQLHVVLEVSESSADESQIQYCNFCKVKLPIKRLLEHIAGHLEELATFVLPNDMESAPAAEGSSGILSSLDSVDDDISIPDMEYVTPMNMIAPTDMGVIDRIDLMDMMGSSTDTERVHLLQGENPNRTDITPVPLSQGSYRCEECGREFDQVHKLK